MVTCNLTLGRLNEEDCEFKTTLENLVRPRLKKTKLNQTKQKKKSKKKLTTKECGVLSPRMEQFCLILLAYLYTQGVYPLEWLCCPRYVGDCSIPWLLFHRPDRQRPPAVLFGQLSIL